MKVDCSRAKFVSSLAALGVATASLSGCNAPGMPETTISTNYHQLKKQIFYAVVRGVQCEIQQAVKKQLKSPYRASLQWLKDWSALVDIKLTFDTQASLNPGVSFLTPMVNSNYFLGDGVKYLAGQSYSLGIGGSVGGDLTRTETVDFFYPFAGNLRFTTPYNPQLECYRFGQFGMIGDLGLSDWLDEALEPYKKCAFIGSAANLQAIKSKEVDDADPENICFLQDSQQALNSIGLDEGLNPVTTFQHQVAFKFTASGNITPTWKLVRVSSPSPSSTLFSAQQQNTSALTITLGPPDRENSKWKPAGGDKTVAGKAAGASGKTGGASMVVNNTIYSPSVLMINRSLSAQIGFNVTQAPPQ